jgi:uncharacterized protein YndB with AHSA1/START domain
MKTTDQAMAIDLPQVRLSRVFSAPRDMVFKAWTTTEHVRRWFAPAGFEVPQARVQISCSGGPFEVCMRAPDGTEHWTRGVFAEVSIPDRLVLDSYAEDPEGRRLFRAWTEVTFTDAPGGGTRIDIVQTYTQFHPAAAPMIGGANEGWASSLRNLQEELERMVREDGAGRSVTHAAFHLERTYEATPAQVFRALSDLEAKSRWFSGPGGEWELLERTMEFRVGGRERLKGRWPGGVVSTFDALYHDIIPNERIIYGYEMHQDATKISVSLATFQLKAAGPGRTTLLLTEQGAFLDDYDDAGSREEGTNQLLDRLGSALTGSTQ